MNEDSKRDWRMKVIDIRNNHYLGDTGYPITQDEAKQIADSFMNQSNEGTIQIMIDGDFYNFVRANVVAIAVVKA